MNDESLATNYVIHDVVLMSPGVQRFIPLRPQHTMITSINKGAIKAHALHQSGTSGLHAIGSSAHLAHVQYRTALPDGR